VSLHRGILFGRKQRDVMVSFRREL